MALHTHKKKKGSMTNATGGKNKPAKRKKLGKGHGK